MLKDTCYTFAMYEAKNSKICNFWTFWPVIQLIPDGIITELSIKISRSAVFASCIARILKITHSVISYLRLSNNVKVL